jgi:hypothetical protein
MSDDVYLTGQDDGGIPMDHKGPPSELEDAALYLCLKQWYPLDDAHSIEWRKQAMDDFDFVACDQWQESTRKSLENEGRNPLTFNYTGPFIEAVKGLEIGTRHETIYLPREVEQGDIIANETISDTSRWMGDLCNAEDAQSEAFGDTVICGMGWSEARMSYEEDDPDGMYVEEKLDVQEMRWDRSAKRKNLSDARRVWRVREMLLEEARDMFPDADDGDLNATWAIGYDVGSTQLKSDEEQRLKLENSHPLDPNNTVHIVQVQWIERECYYRVAKQDGMEEMSEADWKVLQKEAKAVGVKLKAAKQYRKVRKQAFLGSKILGKGPCPDPDRFTLQCITGKLHARKRTWYGLVRLMRDPQMNANKWLSQALHIMNATAKGGIIAERGVFKSITEAQKTYANPQAITVVENDAIAKGRIMQKPGAGLAAPYVQLVQLAIQAIPGVTGINLELLGLRDVNQPGVLEAQRKQAGMTILATLFDALKLYRKTNGETRLCFIQKYIPDGKIIRVNGEMGAKAIRFIRDQHLGKYDVVVSDAPTSPNQKEMTWNMLMQLGQVPIFAPLLQNPATAVECLNYCPLPPKIVQLLQKSLAEPNPDQEQQKMLAMQDALAKITKTKAEAGKIAAETDKIEAETGKVGVDADKSSAEAGAADARAGLNRAQAILALANAGVQSQRETKERDVNRFNQALLRGGPAGMPPRMPVATIDEGLAAGDDMESQLPFPPQLPTAPARGGARQRPMLLEDFGDMFASLPPEAQGGPAAAPPM